MTKKLKVLFMGTTDFSQAILTQLMKMDNVIKIEAVVCQPDRKIDRKKQLIFSPVKQLALANNLILYQPVKVATIYEELASLHCDIIITCAYGQFLPPKILALANIVALNVHASLLPKLRGGAPIHWAIINNESETGITLMKMVKKMDAGAIFVQAPVAISATETYVGLKMKLIALAKKLLAENLLKIATGELVPYLQNEADVTYAYNISRSDELINWTQTAVKISCHIRGLYDNPIAFTVMNGFNYKIHEVIISAEKSNLVPGTIIKIDRDGIHVATQDNNVIIKRIQPAGKTVILAANYCGTKQNPLCVGAIFYK